MPQGGLAPSAVVLVATVRAMKMNGGVAKNDLGDENVDAVKAGCSNLGRHIENLKSFGVPVVVAINHFVKDTDAEVEAVKEFVASQGAEAIVSKHWADGSEDQRNLPHVLRKSRMRIWQTLPHFTQMTCHWRIKSKLSVNASTARMRH